MGVKMRGFPSISLGTRSGWAVRGRLVNLALLHEGLDGGLKFIKRKKKERTVSFEFTH